MTLDLLAFGAAVAVPVSGSDDDDAFAQVLKQSQAQGKPRLLQQQGDRLAPIQRLVVPSTTHSLLAAASVPSAAVDSHRDTRACRPGKDLTCKCVRDCHECLVDANNTVRLSYTLVMC